MEGNQPRLHPSGLHRKLLPLLPPRADGGKVEEDNRSDSAEETEEQQLLLNRQVSGSFWNRCLMPDGTMKCSLWHLQMTEGLEKRDDVSNGT